MLHAALTFAAASRLCLDGTILTARLDGTALTARSQRSSLSSQALYAACHADEHGDQHLCGAMEGVRGICPTAGCLGLQSAAMSEFPGIVPGYLSTWVLE